MISFHIYSFFQLFSLIGMEKITIKLCEVNNNLMA